MALAVLSGGPAQAGAPVDLAIGGTYEFYGQLSPAYLAFDDGALVSDGFVDNANSNSRAGMWYRRPFRWGRLNVNLETSLGFRSAKIVSQRAQTPGWSWTRADIRKAEVIWETGRFGTFSLGQGSMASDGVSNRDLSGTSIVSYVGISDIAGAYFLRTRSGGLSPVAIGAAFPNFDGGRRGRFRYDSPSARGFVLSASVGRQILSDVVSTRDSDIALRYDRNLAGFRIAAATGFTWIDRKALAGNRTAMGSFSIEHKASGISFSASGGSRDTAGTYRYFKLGYKTELARVGPLSISLDYYGANAMVVAGSRSQSYGLGIIQRFANPRIETYLGLRSYKFSDRSPVRYQEAYSVLLGTRWKF